MNDNEELITSEWLASQTTVYSCWRSEVWFTWHAGQAMVMISDGGDTQGLPIRSRGDMRDLVRVFRLQPVGKPYPAAICRQCGEHYGDRRPTMITVYAGTCGICGVDGHVTEPRDYGHLRSGWQNHVEK